VYISFKNYSIGFKEKIFMTLNVQKGIAVAVVVFTLSILKIEGITLILNLTLMFMLYSIIISTFVLKLSHHFVKSKEVIKETNKKKKNED
jgi:NhaP-type Na+/H+ or K+/H+ antiporter